MDHKQFGMTYQSGGRYQYKKKITIKTYSYSAWQAKAGLDKQNPEQTGIIGFPICTLAIHYKH